MPSASIPAWWQGKRIARGISVAMLLLPAPYAVTPAAGETMTDAGLIDDRRSGDMTTPGGGRWRLVSDQVMGGLSAGTAGTDRHDGRDCIRLRGTVTTANNGGFLQIALDVEDLLPADIAGFEGIAFDVAGNDEAYNLHARTSSLWLPWQSYRATFSAGPVWREVRVPFDSLAAYRTNRRFDVSKLERIGIVAIGRDFEADLCLGKIYFYRPSPQAAR